MIGKTRRDGWGTLYPAIAMTAHPQLQAQALVLGTEVVGAAHQEHERFQGFRVANQGSTAPNQNCQARAEGSIQPLDEGGIELGPTVAALEQSDCLFEATLSHTSGDIYDTLALITFDYLTEVNVWSGDQPGTPAFAARQRRAEHPLNCLDIGDEAIYADQQRSGQGTLANDLH